jgi:hypothetical protein
MAGTSAADKTETGLASCRYSAGNQYWIYVAWVINLGRWHGPQVVAGARFESNVLHNVSH